MEVQIQLLSQKADSSDRARVAGKWQISLMEVATCNLATVLGGEDIIEAPEVGVGALCLLNDLAVLLDDDLEVDLVEVILVNGELAGDLGRQDGKLLQFASRFSRPCVTRAASVGDSGRIFTFYESWIPDRITTDCDVVASLERHVLLVHAH